MRCSLSWASGINASGLFREALAEQMAYRDIDRDELSILIEEALTDTNRDLGDLLDQTSSIEDLNALLNQTLQTTSSQTPHERSTFRFGEAMHRQLNRPPLTASPPNSCSAVVSKRRSLVHPTSDLAFDGDCVPRGSCRPAAAQNQVGDVYCNTGVATGIDLVFGAIAGLGLPATAFLHRDGWPLVHAGWRHMRAGGNAEKKNVMSMRTSLCPGIVVLCDCLTRTHR